MMILSRIWYLILGLLVAAAYYVVSLAVGQYNRRNATAMEEVVKADAQVVTWALQVDARRRLDALSLAATDSGVGKALRGANGKERVPNASVEEGAKALAAFNDKLPAEYKNDALFVTDRDGRVIAQIGYDASKASSEFELGGYPAVNDALHGFLRDDTWVWGGRIARVVARPVEDEVGQPPLGSVVGLRWIDNSFAKEIGKRTRTNIAFFVAGQEVARAASTEGLDDGDLETLASDLPAIADDESFKESGRTAVRPIGDGTKGGALFLRVPGEAWDLGASFAVARPKVSIGTALGFLQGADDADKKNVKLWIVALVAFVAAFIGLLFSYFEHSRPMKEMARQAARLKKGEIDTLALPNFRGGLRPIAADINDGIQRVVEKGGGTARKPADLESILGPVPAQPSMSAFSFPLSDASSPQIAGAAGAAAGAAAGPSPSGPRPPGAPPPPTSRANLGPPPKPSKPGGPSATGGFAPEPASGARPVPFSANGGTLLPKVPSEDAPSSVDVLSSVGSAAAEPMAEWNKVYEDFLRLKRECGEATDGLTFDKFQQTLRKNRDALIQRHGCKHVKFSVYVKEGRASLKATPVRD